MENTNEINQKIAKNLIYYRKAANLTQAELAEKINYSDKSVSKWESGNGVPDVYTLLQLSKLYGVSLNQLVGEEPPAPVPVPQKAKISTGLRVLIMLLSSGIVWLVAILVFVALQIASPDGGAWWLAFLYAVAVNAIVLVVYASIWKQRILNFISISTLIWTSILCLYLTISEIVSYMGGELHALGFVFLLGVPLQILEILWTFFRTLLRREKKANMGNANIAEEKK
jgi:transcriptional regulator with XRE-family HTH domain